MNNENDIQLTWKAARVNKGLKRPEVAEMLNITVQTLVNWEDYKTLPDIYQAVLLCEIYCLDIKHIKIKQD